MHIEPLRQPLLPLALLLSLTVVACDPGSVLPGGGPRDFAPRESDLAMTLLDFATPLDQSTLPDAAADAAMSDMADAGPVCIGARPPNNAWGAKPAPWRLPMDGGALPDGGGFEGTPTPGSPAPLWALLDFQPQSCGFGATYGLDTFKGRPLAVALWAGW